METVSIELMVENDILNSWWDNDSYGTYNASFATDNANYEIDNACYATSNACYVPYDVRSVT